MKEKKPSFLREIRQLMYAHGDVLHPRMDTANVIHEYLCKYLEGILKRAKHVSKSRGRTKTEDLLYTVKRDRKKYIRTKELLSTNDELKKARKIFDYEDLARE